MSEFTLNAESRDLQGKGASRRLRREGKIPAVIYGGAKNRKPASLTLELREVAKAAENEAFYASVLTLNVDGKEEQAVIMDMQRHPARDDIMHIDFQRVTKSTIVHKKVPLHFINEESCKGVKLQGGKIQHNLTEVDTHCKAANLPEFIEVDLAGAEVGTVLHLSDLKLPKGVELVALSHGDDQPVLSVVKPKGADTEEEEGGEEAASEE